MAVVVVVDVVFVVVVVVSDVVIIVLIAVVVLDVVVVIALVAPQTSKFHRCKAKSLSLQSLPREKVKRNPGQRCPST